MPSSVVCAPPSLFPHVCGAHCGRAASPATAPGVALPPWVTLQAPASTRYSELLAALSAARALGVRRATVVVELPGTPYPAQ